jgi:hypothetical protein
MIKKPLSPQMTNSTNQAKGIPVESIESRVRSEMQQMLMGAIWYLQQRRKILQVSICVLEYKGNPQQAQELFSITYGYTRDPKVDEFARKAAQCSAQTQVGTYQHNADLGTAVATYYDGICVGVDGYPSREDNLLVASWIAPTVQILLKQERQKQNTP